MNRTGRVLIVDDMQQWREGLVEILLDGDLYAESVSSISGALQKLEESFYHVLILDIRMDECDAGNVDGLMMLKELEKRGLSDAVKVVILSAYGTQEHIRQSFRKYHVADFLSKDLFDDQRFLETVSEIFLHELHINLDLQVHWESPQVVEQVLRNLELNGGRLKRASPLRDLIAVELDDLLCRLFHQAKSILLQPMKPGHSGTGVLWVQPFYGTGGGKAVMIKFGAPTKITEEQRNFQNYVRLFIGGGRTTTILSVRRTGHLGGIMYSLLGTSSEHLEDIGTFYQHARIDDICETLDRLFLDTCKAWYANLGHLQLYDLTTDYLRSLGFSMERLEQVCTSYMKSVQGQRKLSIKSLDRTDRTFTNPLSAIANHSFLRSTYMCITHGDLNQHNLMVDESMRTWLIDFQGTGQSHALRDVAMLDSIVRFQLLESQDATLQERLLMEDILCRVRRFSQLESLEGALATENAPLAKAYATVVHLRLIARRIVMQNPNDDLSEYSVALLYNALNTLRFTSLPICQREHALVSASLLVDQLLQ